MASGAASKRGGRPRAGRLALLAALYLVAFVLLDTASWSIERLPGIAAFYPSDGLALASIYVVGLRMAPVVFVGYALSTCVVHGFADVPLMLAASAVGAAIHAGGVLLITRVLRADLTAGQLGHLMRFVVGVVVIAAAGAVTITGTLLLSGDVPRADAGSVLFTASTGLAIGILMVAPGAALAARRLREWLAGARWPETARPGAHRGRLLDGLVLLATTGVTVLVAFWSRSRELEPLYLCFVPIVWLGLRRGLPGAAVATMVVDTAVVIAFRASGLPPPELDKIQLFQIALTLTGLVLGTVVTEREAAQARARKEEVLRRELELARRIQIEVLPRTTELPGFDMAGAMRAASQVGGDFYDIVPSGEEGGFWLLIGDVSGHGLDAGLVMLMAQAAAQATVRARPATRPAELVAQVNRVIYENVRVRMRRDDYVTFLALRHHADGRFVAAGGHLPVFVARGNGRVETIEPRGPWCGVQPDIAAHLEERELVLAAGDLLCVITDGLVEARNQRGEMFGEERLLESLREARALGCDEALARLLGRVQAFMHRQDDDITAVLLKRTPAA
jgi:serine phosphatase RsbU (regulator of sigma subunit)/integral membrane sensor domain MASE1